MTQQIADAFGRNPKLANQYLSAKELKAVLNNDGLTGATFGKALEKAVAQQTASKLDRLSRPGLASPDFISKITGKHYDLTVDSARSIREHLIRSYVANGSTELIRYYRPVGFRFLP